MRLLRESEWTGLVQRVIGVDLTKPVRLGVLALWHCGTVHCGTVQTINRKFILINKPASQAARTLSTMQLHQ